MVFGSASANTYLYRPGLGYATRIQEAVAATYGRAARPCGYARTRRQLHAEGFSGYAEADDSGSTCSSILSFEGNSLKGLAVVGTKNSSPNEVGKEAATITKDEIQNTASVDEQLADQLILPLAFAPSGSSYTFDKIYEHVETNLGVMRHFLGDIFKLEKEENIYRLTRL